MIRQSSLKSNMSRGISRQTGARNHNPNKIKLMTPRVTTSFLLPPIKSKGK